MIYIQKFGISILVLNSQQVVHDLLENRGNIYSSRPRRVMANELMGWGWMFSAMPYGPVWRQYRALFQKHFHIRASPQYQPVQEEEARVLLHNLLYCPENFAYHVKRNAAAVFMRLSYGHQIGHEGDVFVSLADKATGHLAKAGIFGSYLVDYLPLLKYVPAWMAEFKRHSLEWRKSTEAMVNYPFEHLQKRMASGIVQPSLASVELEEVAKSGPDPQREEMIRNVAGMSYAAGSDTTVAAILSFILAMVIYPDIQAHAQEEIRRVVGPDRLPSFSDKDALPIVEGLVWESLRWNPVTPLGLQHMTSEEDVYRGYLIPKGTAVFPNVWKILHDEQAYPNPFSFDPLRYANNSREEYGVNQPPMAAFGFGRRICPGRHLAIDSIWIAIVTILHVFDIKKALDGNGSPIEPDIEYPSSFLSRPKPFQCRFILHSEAMQALIQRIEE